MKPTAITAPATESAVTLKPLAVCMCAGMAVIIALLCCAPDPMVKDWGIGLLLALEVEAPVVWLLVLDSPDLWHVAVFAALTLGLLVTIPGRPHLCVNTAMLLGVFLEAAQMFVPGRTAGFIDLLYNLAGASLAFFLFKALRPLLKAIRNVVKKTSHHPLSLETQRAQRGVKF
jgi:hypothetical protein